MTLEEIENQLNKEIERLSNIGIHKLYANDKDIIGEGIAEILTMYFNNKGISIEIKKCVVQNNWDLMLWW
jgi:hypothetical protein